MIRTAESVTIGHPDKICDQVVDAILDEYLRQDQMTRAALEAAGGHGKLIIFGELTSSAGVDMAKIARRIYREIGYQDSLEVETRIVKQSPDIAQGVNQGGAGDQGIMVGYATTETPEMLPKPFMLARKLARKLEDFSKINTFLGPDGKTQVTMDGDKVATVLISTQHQETMPIEEVRKVVVDKIIAPVIGDLSNIKVLINPTGRFVIGGFNSDSGVSGRKLVVDNYGPDVSIGGGSFPGKDPTKVDRSAAYMARYLAKYLVLKYKIREAIVKLAYAIGVREPLMVAVEADDNQQKMVQDIANNFDLTPLGIIKFLDLRQPIYLRATRLGNFGDSELPWERVKI